MRKRMPQIFQTNQLFSTRNASAPTRRVVPVVQRCMCCLKEEADAPDFSDQSVVFHKECVSRNKKSCSCCSTLYVLFERGMRMPQIFQTNQLFSTRNASAATRNVVPVVQRCMCCLKEEADAQLGTRNVFSRLGCRWHGRGWRRGYGRPRPCRCARQGLRRTR